jgi:flagella basal body P-ring formation protein FlgA
MTAKFAGIAGLVLALSPAWALASQESVLDRAHEVLLAALKERQPGVERFELVPLGPGLAKWRSMDASTAEVSVGHDASSARRAKVAVRYARPDGSRREAPIWWSVRAFEPVLVARRLVRANETVTADDFVLQAVDVAGIRRTMRAFESDGPVRKARRFISAGAVLRETDLEPVPEVARDQQVKVRVGAGSVRIETVGIATEQGRLGQIIRVANPASRLRYSARISGEGEVTLGSWTQ